MTYEQSRGLWYKKLKLKLIIMWTWFEIMTIFQNEMSNLADFLHFNFFYSKRVDTNNVIYCGNYEYFKEHVAKKILQKILFMKKSKCLQTAHLWLNPLLLLVHLIVISPKSWSFFNQHIFVLNSFTFKSSFKFQWDGMTGMPSTTLEHVESCEFSCQGWDKCNCRWITRCCCFTNNGDGFVCIIALVCHMFSYYIIDVPSN